MRRERKDEGGVREETSGQIQGRVRASCLPSAVACPGNVLPRLHPDPLAGLVGRRRRGEAATGREREVLGLDPEDDVGLRRLGPATRISREWRNGTPRLPSHKRPTANAPTGCSA